MSLRPTAARGALIAVLVVTASLICSSAAVAARSPSIARIDLGAGQALRISAGSRDVVKTSVKSGPARLGCTQILRTYRIGSRKKPAGTLAVTVRTLPSGSRLIFAELRSPKSWVPVSLQLSGQATSSVLNDMGLTPNLTYSSKTGVDKTSGPIGWVDFFGTGEPTSSVFVSKAYEFKNLTKKYTRTRQSTVRQFIRESRAIGLDQDPSGKAMLKLGMSAKRSSSQRYLLLASRTITDTATAGYSLGHVTRHEWKWMDPLGTYGKAPYSIEPKTRIGYVRDLVLARGSTTLHAYRATSSPLYEDLLINNLYALSLTRSRDGLWRTNYTSTWVKGQSGITAPFIDTRNNEVLATQFLSITTALAEKGANSAAEARGWSIPYSSYLLGRERAGAVARTSSNGIFFGDYYDGRGTLKTHTSLNHALGEMNYLLTLYLETGNPALLSTALRIKAAVDDTNTQWIRPNRDLWYQRNTNGGYAGTDYPTVTYFDLLNSQRLFTQILGAPDPTFTQLVTSKAAFIGVTPPAVWSPITESQASAQSAATSIEARAALP